MEQTLPVTSEQEPVQQATGVLKFLGHLISYVFHPLFIPTLVSAYLIYLHPYAFAGNSSLLKLQRLLSVFVNTAFIPGFAVFLMWRLKLIESIYLRTVKERIIPYAAAIIFYFWGWYVLSRQQEIPPMFVDFLQGSFFAVCGAWIVNINSKISMHTTAMGGLLAFMIIFSFTDDNASGLYLALAILIAGLVGTARFLVSDHSKLEIVQGYVVGILAQVVAYFLN